MTQLIKNGSKGDAVSQLQEDLNALGFSVRVDGIFGPNTGSGVEQLQWMFGYTVDGIVGEGTQKLITQQKQYGWKANSREGLVSALEMAR